MTRKSLHQLLRNKTNTNSTLLDHKTKARATGAYNSAARN